MLNSVSSGAPAPVSLPATGAVRCHRQGRGLAEDELTSGPAAASGTVTHHPKPQPPRGLSSSQCEWGPGRRQEGSVFPAVAVR